MSSLPGNYLSKPYGILKKFTIGGETYIGEYADAVNANLAAVDASFDNTLDNVLKAAADNERAKEKAYLEKLFAKVFNDDNYRPIIYNEVKSMYDQIMTPGEGISEVWLSQVIDTLQKLLSGLYDFDKSLAQNMALMKDFNKVALSDPLMKGIDQAFEATKSGRSYLYNTTNIANKSGATILKEVCNNIHQNIENYLNSNKSKTKMTDFTEQQQKLIEQLQQEYKIRLQKFYTEKFQVITDLDVLDSNLEDLNKKIIEYNSTVKAKDKINADNKPIQQYVHELLRGAFGGQALEIGISLGGGGAETGKVINAAGRSIDADNILLGTASLSFSYPDMDKLTQQSQDIKKRIQLTEIKNEINDIESLENGLVIMTSAKDQSTNKSFNSFTATNTKVKLKDPGSLKTRRTEIERMFDAAGCGGVDDLIFALANLAKDFVYEGQIDMAKKNLGTVCLVWMFDDAVEIVQDGSMFGNNISTLHFYNINNYIYTLSDILYKTASNVQAKLGQGGITKTGKNMNYVNVTISGTKHNPYIDLLSEHDQLQGIARWDFVSEELMSNITIGVNMNVKNLFNQLFTFK